MRDSNRSAIIANFANNGILKAAVLADAAHVNTQRWCEGLMGAGIELHVISFQGEVPSAKRNYHLPFRRLPGKLSYFAAAPFVRRLLKQIQPDLLLAYYVTGYGTLGMLTGFHPLVLVTAGSDVLIKPKNPILARIRRHNLAQADLITAWAPHMAEAAVGCGASRERIFILPRGIPVEVFSKCQSTVPKAGDPLRLSSTRSLRAPYRIDLLIRSVAHLRQTGLNVELMIMGEGPERFKLEELSKSLKIDPYVRFAGFVCNEDLPGELAKTHVYVSVAFSDGVSASLLESMAVGLIPVVPDIEANRFWIEHGKNGILLESDDPCMIASGIRAAFEKLGSQPEIRNQNRRLVMENANFQENSRKYRLRFEELVQQFRMGRPDGRVKELA